MEKLYHIQCKEGDLGRYVLMPGDPFRTDMIAKRLDDAKLVAHNREYKSWTGTLDGVKVSVLSTGIGPASAAIAVEEAIKVGSDTFIRIGTAGRVSEKALDKSVLGVIATGAVRDESLTQEYVPISYPAIAHLDIVNAMDKAAKDLDLNFLKGISHSKQSFYGQFEPERMPLSDELKRNWNIYKKANVASTEMESSTIFVISSLFEKRGGSVLAFNDNTEAAIDLAIAAVRNLIKLDKDTL